MAEDVDKKVKTTKDKPSEKLLDKNKSSARRGKYGAKNSRPVPFGGGGLTRALDAARKIGRTVSETGRITLPGAKVKINELRPPVKGEKGVAYSGSFVRIIEFKVGEDEEEARLVGEIKAALKSVERSRKQADKHRAAIDKLKAETRRLIDEMKAV